MKARTFLTIGLIVLNQFGPITSSFGMTDSAGTDASPAGASTGSVSSSDDYRIGEDDELAISVYGDPDLSKTQTVRPGGRISFPLVGDIKASELTADELRQELVRRIARYRRDPQVTVIVTKYNSRKISVLGQVKVPGLLRLSSDITLLDAISRAGGLTEEADLQGALLVRNGQIQPVDFEKLLRDGDFTQNVPLQSNDVVLIPNVRDKKVSVVGQVSKPQVIALTAGMTLVESISRTGGLTEDADLQGALLVRNGQIQPVDFEKLLRQGDFSQNLPLRPNDVVLIPNVKDKKVSVLGQVAKPQVISLGSGVTLVESISRAGGLTDDADLQGALLVRNQQIQPVNFEKLFREGDFTQNVILQPNDVVLIPNVKDKKIFVLGEVVRPNTMPVKSGLTLIEAIATAGGFTADAKRQNVLIARGGLANPKLITVNVDTISQRDASQNVLLQPGDIVYVPRSVVANVVRFFQNLSSILTPFVLASTGIVLGPQVQAVLTGSGSSMAVPVNTSPTVIGR